MREELERIQKIEMLLNGQLTGQEKAAFEQQIAADPQLQADVKAQQTVLSGLERLLLGAGIKKAALRFKWTRWLLRGGVGFAVVAVVVFSALFFSGRPAYNGKSLPEYNESGQKQWAYADTAIAPQSFSVTGSKDTVIETKGGIVLAVPAGCFLDKSGEHITGKVELVIKEALEPSTIIEAGLSTTSNSKLLETGGMFFIDARHNGESLNIDPKNSIYAQVPADSIKAGMQLFHGERVANGSINWVNPKPIEHDLVPVDINTLNFYPPYFLQSLANWGYDSKNKKFTDSLYYSLAALFVDSRTMLNTANDSVINVTMPATADCALNPAKIKAIWNNKFQSTLLATREFEERVQTIHRSFDAPGMLDLYVSNLDKPLYQIDSLAASRDWAPSSSDFLKFAARHDGKVNVTKKQLLQLKKYYEIKSKIYTIAALKTQHDFDAKQAELNKKAEKRRVKHSADSLTADERNYLQEFSLNLREACRQLGYAETNLNAIPQNTYNVQVISTGWCNIDRAVEESLNARTSLSYTDNQTGKNASIRYKPFSFRITDVAKYDRVLVYLLPDKLNSFINVQEQNGIYQEKLNELIKYDLICLGYKNDLEYVYLEKSIRPQDLSISLNETSDKEIIEEIRSLGRKEQTFRLAEEYTYQHEETKEQQRERANISALQLRNALVLVAFPCWITGSRPAEADDTFDRSARIKADSVKPPLPTSAIGKKLILPVPFELL